MIRIYISSLFLLLSIQIFAQELEATVRVTVPTIQLADPAVFTSMEAAIEDFFSTQTWTEDYFEDEERIECSFQINIKEELNETNFRADVAFQSIRPVYGSDYKTSLITHVDKDVQFSYEQFQPIQDSRDFYRENLSSLLTYYVFIILGYDYDTFSELGGEPYFQIAQNILNTIPPSVTSSDNAWTAQGRRGARYWIVENMLSPRMRDFRRALYTYHRFGLDMMHEDPEKALQTMTDALTTIERANVAYPNSLAVQMFVNAKSEEIIEVFKGASRAQRNKAYSVMRKIDPANASKYNVLNN